MSLLLSQTRSPKADRAVCPSSLPSRELLGWAKPMLGAFLLAVVIAGCSGGKERDPVISALHFFQRGNAAYVDQDYPGAVLWYQRAQQEDPMSPDIAYNLGLALYQSGLYEPAATAFQQALKLDPNFSDAHMNLALAYDRLYNHGAAHHHYNKYQSLALSRAPANSPETAASPQAASGASMAKPVFQASAPAEMAAGPGKARSVTATPPVKPVGANLSKPVGAKQIIPVKPAPPANATAPSPAPATQEGSQKWWIQDQKPSPW
ncbi:MAG: tetratricopeptide repeat protein [Deltaproteobacteria bacterium]|nr:tetratricopeptide repeat protein [Deltaproteobacteria bacterium]